MNDKWCPENDGAYRAERAEVERTGAEDLQEIYDWIVTVTAERDELRAWRKTARRELIHNCVCPDCFLPIHHVSFPAMGWECTGCPWNDHEEEMNRE